MGHRDSCSAERLSNPYRRRFLQGLGATGLAGLAGCSGDSGENGNGDGNGNGNGQNSSNSEVFSMMMGGSRPDQMSWNPYGKNYIGDRLGNLVYEGLVKWNHASDEDDDYWPQILEDFEFPETTGQGETVTLNIYPEYTWTDGSDYTSEDLVGQLELERYDGWGYWNFLEEAQAVDDYTVELTMSSNVDPQIFKNDFFEFMGYHKAQFKYDVYGEYLEGIQESTTDEEKQIAREELSDYQITGAEANNLGIGLGPFSVYEDAATSRLVVSKYEDYTSPLIDASDIPYDRTEGLPVDSPQEKIRAMQNRTIDAISNAEMTEEQYESLPEQYDSVPTPTSDGGVFVFNCRRPPLDNQKVRWALSNVFRANHDLLIQNLSYMSEMKPKTDVSTGLGRGYETHERWLDDVIDDFMWFDGGEERAAELLREEGFTQEDGEWYLPNGDPFELEFKAATFHSDRTQTAAQVLSEFGIPTTPIVEEDTVWFSQTIENYEYDLTNWWGGQGNGIVYQGLNGLLRNEADLSAYLEGVPSPAEWEEEMNEGFVIELPSIGDPNGSREEFDIDETLQGLATAQSDDERREAIQQLAWAWNWMDAYWGPWLVYQPSMFYNTDPWDWPSTDDDVMNVVDVSYWPTRTGEPSSQ